MVNKVDPENKLVSAKTLKRPVEIVVDPLADVNIISEAERKILIKE